MDKSKLGWMSVYVKRMSYQDCGLLLSDVFCSDDFLRMWTFLCTHGHSYTALNKFVKEQEVKHEGKCISWASTIVDYYNKEHRLPDKYFPKMQYVEGVNTQEPLSLHAWAGMETQRHHLCFDITRPLELHLNHLIEYKGVPFDLEFFDWVREAQRKNGKVDTLPYLLGQGVSCLTYKPLLEGKVNQYPIKDGDQEAAIQLLEPFVNKWRGWVEGKVEERNNANVSL